MSTFDVNHDKGRAFEKRIATSQLDIYTPTVLRIAVAADQRNYED